MKLHLIFLTVAVFHTVKVLAIELPNESSSNTTTKPVNCKRFENSIVDIIMTYQKLSQDAATAESAIAKLQEQRENFLLELKMIKDLQKIEKLKEQLKEVEASIEQNTKITTESAEKIAILRNGLEEMRKQCLWILKLKFWNWSLNTIRRMKQSKNFKSAPFRNFWNKRKINI